MSYKVNDLRRLKKAELLEIIRNSPITLSSSKPTKQHLINCLLSAERSEDSASQHPRDAGTDALPVALNSDFLNYQALTDDFLVSAVSDDALSTNSSVQSIIHRMFVKFPKDAGSVCAVMSRLGNGFRVSSSFSISSIQVLNIRDSIDTCLLYTSPSPRDS